MTNIFRFLLIILLLFFINANHAHTVLPSYTEDGEGIKTEKKNLVEAEKHLKFLLKKRNVFVGDFYGVNLTAYRYVHVFHRMGYIRYKIIQIDKEIKKVKFKISEIKKKLSFSRKSFLLNFQYHLFGIKGGGNENKN